MLERPENRTSERKEEGQGWTPVPKPREVQNLLDDFLQTIKNVASGKIKPGGRLDIDDDVDPERGKVLTPSEAMELMNSLKIDPEEE